MTNSVDNEDGNGEKANDDVDLTVSTDVDLHEGASCNGSLRQTEQSCHPMAELLPESINLRKENEKKVMKGKHTSSDSSKRHPAQYLVQPAIDPSQMVKLSHVHNYLRTAKQSIRLVHIVSSN